METVNDFEESRPRPDKPSPLAFVVDIDGYEGPIDVLLTLAREQKVDVTRISIMQLADQYLEFVAEARRANLELAADYLVMAAWLAYLKSRLLLPDLGGGEEPSGEEMAAALAFQLQRLEAMQESGRRLMARPQLGRDFFSRGDPDRLAADTTTELEVGLYDLLRAYADQRRRRDVHTLHIEAWTLYTVEDALQRLQRLLGKTPEWESLWRFLPDGLQGGLKARSALASTFAASLELARQGRLRLRQGAAFGPIYVSATGAQGEGPAPARTWTGEREE